MAITKLERLKPVTFPNPRAVPINPPINAPTIPIIIFAIIPPGSFPGRIHSARAPAINPNIIQEIIS